MIEAAGLTKRYGDKLAVDDLGFGVFVAYAAVVIIAGAVLFKKKDA